MRSLKELQEALRRGENITQLLRADASTALNTEQIIEATYDLQAGSYSRMVRAQGPSGTSARLGHEIAECINKYTRAQSILDAGTGEATTLSYVLKALLEFDVSVNLSVHGCDISWSRLAYAKRWIAEEGLTVDRRCGIRFCAASIRQLPYADNSFDVVFTCHSVEPNGGNESLVLRELYRVTSRYLILFEPSTDFASPSARQRMTTLGYCQDLVKTLQTLGYSIRENRPARNILNALNPTAAIVIEKNPQASPADPQYICPLTGCSLRKMGTVYGSLDSFFIYPIIGDIPCMRKENGIIASKYHDNDGATINFPI